MTIDTITSAIENREEKKFINYLKSNAELTELNRILTLVYVNHGLLYFHDKKKRTTRDLFFKSAMDSLDEKSEKRLLIYNKIDLIHKSESIFDKLSSNLESVISKSGSPAEQAWACIRKTEHVIYKIKTDNALEINNSTNQRRFSFHKKTKDSNGEDYDPDTLLEKEVKSLSLSLKFLAFRNKWEKNGVFFIPDTPDTVNFIYNEINETKELAITWEELERITNCCFINNGEAFENKNENLVRIKEEYNIDYDVNYSFQYRPSSFVTYEQIASDRFRERNNQDLMKIIDHLGKKRFYDNECNLQIDNILTHIMFDNYFCCDVRTDQKTYGGLRLVEWINCFLALKKFAASIEGKSNYQVLNIETVINILSPVTSSTELAFKFINAITFSKDSIDLFDTPIIKISDDKLYLLISAIYSINIFQAVLSRLTSIEDNLGEKGYNFEKQVLKMLNGYNLNAKSIKRTFNNETYEYDCLFFMGKKLFLLECKNKSISWGIPTKNYRNGLFYEETARQINRLKEGLLEHPEIIADEFNKNVNDYEIVPVIYNCYPLSMPKNILDVYVIDHSSFSRLFKSKHINSIALFGESKKTAFSQWKNNTIDSDDIIRHLNEPFQLKFYKNSIKPIIYFRKENNISFSSIDYIFDHERINKNSMNLLKKTKKKPK